MAAVAAFSAACETDEVVPAGADTPIINATIDQRPRNME
jgi:hypothetical protein